MRKIAIAAGVLVILGTAFHVWVGCAQEVAEFRLGKVPAHVAETGPQHLSFTLAARGPEVTGARIYLAPAGKTHPERRTWRYVGMVSFFPASANEQAMFDLPVHRVVREGQKMIAEPIVEGKGGAGALRILAASVAEEDHSAFR